MSGIWKRGSALPRQIFDSTRERWASTHWMASNQLRLWFSAFALLIFERLRTVALSGPQLAKATVGTIRQRLLKIGAVVTLSTRRVYVRLASAFPLQKLFAQAHQALAAFKAEGQVIPRTKPPEIRKGRPELEDMKYAG